jgi:hypothetical protein
MRARASGQWFGPCLGLAWVLYTALAMAPVAHAQPDAKRTFQRVERLLRQFQYGEATALLQDFISRDVSPSSELEARKKLVIALASAKELEAARREATQLYTRDPGYELSNPQGISPRIRRFFADARREARASPPADIHVKVRTSDDTILLRLSARTSALVTDTTLEFRQPGQTSWTEAAVERQQGTVFEATLERRQTIQYYARMRTPSGYVVAQAGRPEAPLEWRSGLGASAGTTEDAEDSDGGVATGWIVGGVAAAVVAGTATAILVAQPWNDGSGAETIQLP